MNPEQMLALLSVIADMRIQIERLVRENQQLRTQQQEAKEE
jgi:regulator of replication initiation timing